MVLIVLIVTFNSNSIGSWNRWKFNVRDFSSVFIMLPNWDNDHNEAVLKEPQNSFEQLYVLSHDRSWGRGWAPVKPV